MSFQNRAQNSNFSYYNLKFLTVFSGYGVNLTQSFEVR